MAGAEAMLRAALAEDPVAAAGLQEPGRHPLPERPLRRGARGLRAGRQARPRAGRRPLLQAGQHRLQAAGPGAGAGELELGPPRSIPGISWPGPTSRCWTWPSDAADDAAFAALARQISRDARLRARGLQGQVPPPADRGADARVRRAHLRRLPGAAGADARRVRAAAGRAHHQRHPLLPQRGDLEPAPARRAAGAAATRGRREVRAWSAGCSSGEEPYTLAMLVAEHLDRAGRGDELARLTIDATDIDRAMPRARAGGALPAARRSPRCPPSWPGATSSRPAPSGGWSSGSRRRVRVRALDLSREPPLRPNYHLILCRNVVIYFDRADAGAAVPDVRRRARARRLSGAGQGGDALRRRPRAAHAGRPARADLPAARVSAGEIVVRVADLRVGRRGRRAGHRRPGQLRRHRALRRRGPGRRAWRTCCCPRPR